MKKAFLVAMVLILCVLALAGCTKKVTPTPVPTVIVTPTPEVTVVPTVEPPAETPGDIVPEPTVVPTVTP